MDVSKVPYLTNVGWKGFVDGIDSGVYMTTRLSNLNASEGMATPRVQEEYERFYSTLGGISLMEHLIGYERAILIDAMASGHVPGSVIISDLMQIPDVSAFHTTSAHDTSLQTALKLGKAVGAALPEQITVVGIATNHVYDFSEELSLPVAQAISTATQIVIDLL